MLPRTQVKESWKGGGTTHDFGWGEIDGAGGTVIEPQPTIHSNFRASFITTPFWAY